MAEKVVMIALSPTMNDGKIHRWQVKEGDTVELGQVLCEVETDKSTMEYESINEGRVLKILVQEGGSARVGQSIAIFGNEGEDISDLLRGEEASAPPPAQEKAPPSRDMGSSVAPAVVETNRTVHAKVAPVNQERIKATPLARKRAKELRVDLSLVQGTGTNGRIQRTDVEHFVGAGTATASTAAPQKAAEVQAPLPAQVKEFDKELPVEGVRSVIAAKLSESKFSAPHFYVKTSMQTDALMALRSKVNAELPVKVSLNAFIIKLTASAIRKNPLINSSWKKTAYSAAIVHHSSIDIALAVDLGNGLITPVIRDCQFKNVEQIEKELQYLIQKVKQQTIAPEEYSNATFTISNLGSFGVEEFTAIINPPAASILAVGMSRKVPVVSADGQIEVATKMSCTLSSDHRVIDGAAAALFMKDFKNLIENPALAIYF